jgi:orotidine-5'-phosphate decarboxylase
MDEEDLNEIGVNAAPQEQVVRLATLAVRSGLRGIVCSPLELEILRKTLPQEIKIVTPGIRSPDDAKNDQKRTMTPKEAIAAGADYIVVGRPITAAKNPREAAEKILNLIT